MEISSWIIKELKEKLISKTSKKNLKKNPKFCFPMKTVAWEKELWTHQSNKILHFSFSWNKITKRIFSQKLKSLQNNLFSSLPQINSLPLNFPPFISIHYSPKFIPLMPSLSFLFITCMILPTSLSH